MSKKPPNDPLCQRAMLTGVPKPLIELARERYFIWNRLIVGMSQFLLGAVVSKTIMVLEDRLFVFTEPYDSFVDLVSFLIFSTGAFFLIRSLVRMHSSYKNEIRRI